MSITNSQSLLKLVPTESAMPSNHLILCRPFLLPPSIFPSISVFSDELALCIRRPKYWSFSLSISLSRISWLSAVLGVLWPVAASLPMPASAFTWLSSLCVSVFAPSHGRLLSVCLCLCIFTWLSCLCVSVSVPSHDRLPSVFLSLCLHLTVLQVHESLESPLPRMTSSWKNWLPL